MTQAPGVSLAIIAALPREIAAAGMGAARAALGVEAALSAAPITVLVSTGLAGACMPGLPAGSVAEARLIVDTRTGERFATGADAGCVLATTDSIASVEEKSRLAAAYNAAMVDMEAATVARLAAAHGLRIRAIKAISDAHDAELGPLGRFTGRHGSFRTGAFAVHTALRPHTWGRAAKLGRDSSRALAALHDALRAIILS